MAKIEFYVRHNCNGAMLNIYLCPESKDLLLKALQKNGQIDGEHIEMNLELNVQPEWIRNPDNPKHLKIPVSLLNLQDLVD